MIPENSITEWSTHTPWATRAQIEQDLLLGRIASKIGFDSSTELNKIPKFFMRTRASDGSKIKIKIEINAHERAFAHPRIRLKHTVTSNWFSSSAEILTFQVEEMMATKIRALYQRRKGRDLFDFWLALNVLNLDPTVIVSSFACYNPGITSKQSIANLREKLLHKDFRLDLSFMLIDLPAGYEIDQAAEELIEKVLSII